MKRTMVMVGPPKSHDVCSATRKTILLFCISVHFILLHHCCIFFLFGSTTKKMNIHWAKRFIHYKIVFVSHKFCNHYLYFWRSQQFFFSFPFIFFCTWQLFFPCVLIVYPIRKLFCQREHDRKKGREREREIVFLGRKWTLIYCFFSKCQIVVGYLVVCFFVDSFSTRATGCDKKSDQLLYSFGCLPSQCAVYRKTDK